MSWFIKTVPGWLLAVCVVLFIQSCDKYNKTKIQAPSGNYQHGVWIINEGNYNSGNASVDFYHTDVDSLETGIFYNTNKRPLGDVLQSMVHFADKYFLVVNNSNRIEVTDGVSFKSVASLDIIQPRYFLPVNNQKAYVSSNTGECISIINPADLKVTGSIHYNPGPDSWGSWTEQMALYGTTVFATAVKRGKLLVINSSEDKITDSITLSAGAKNIVIDKENQLWVLCDGTLADQPVQSELFCIDPLSRQIIHQYFFPDKKTGAANLQINSTGDTLYYNYGGIIKMGIHETALAITPFIAGNFYGLGVDPHHSSVFTGDAKNFDQKGMVFRYSASGILQKSFPAGVGPNGFLFVP